MNTRFDREDEDLARDSWAAKVVANAASQRTTFKVEVPSKTGSPGLTVSDIYSPTVNNDRMNDITRHELNARLEAIEARMDGRVASIEGGVSSIRAEMKGFLAAQAERDKRFEELLEASRRDSDQRLATLVRDVDRLGSLKANIWSAMATTIIILVAIGALGLTAFQAGAAKSIPAPEKAHLSNAPLQDQPTHVPAMPTSDISSD